MPPPEKRGYNGLSFQTNVGLKALDDELANPSGAASAPGLAVPQPAASAASGVPPAMSQAAFGRYVAPPTPAQRAAQQQKLIELLRRRQ